MQNPSYKAQMSAWVICEIKQMSQVTLQSKIFLIRVLWSKMKGFIAVIVSESYYFWQEKS